MRDTIFCKNYFLLTGAPGSGKSTVLHELRRRGYRGVDEAARQIIAEQRTIGGNGIYDRDPSLFHELILSRSIAQFHAYIYSEFGDAPVIFDRGIPDSIGYGLLFGLDVQPAEAAAKIWRYNATAFFLPSWPEIYATDEDRRMSVDDARAFGENLRVIYLRAGYTVVDVPRGSAAQRVDFILDAIMKCPNG